MYGHHNRHTRDELLVFCFYQCKHAVFASYSMRQTAACCYPPTTEYYRTGWRSLFCRLFSALGIICFQKNLDTFSFLFRMGPGYTLSTA